MDFITKGDKDLKHTEMFYGKHSDQYALHKVLLDAENTLKTTGYLKLGKQCKEEYITITYRLLLHFKADNAISKTKTHWNKEKTEIRKTKENVLDKSISSLINDEVYDLILNGKYKVLEG